MKQLVTRQQMEAFARNLETAKKSQALPAEEFNALHTKFGAEDAAGGVWTVGIHTTKWHRLDSGKWTPGNPPDSLALDEQVVEALQKLATPSTPTQPVNSDAELSVTICARCGAKVKAGKTFCSACGSPVSALPVTLVARPCPRCGQTVPAGKKFCTACGMRL